MCQVYSAVRVLTIVRPQTRLPSAEIASAITSYCEMEVASCHMKRARFLPTSSMRLTRSKLGCQTRSTSNILICILRNGTRAICHSRETRPSFRRREKLCSTFWLILKAIFSDIFHLSVTERNRTHYHCKKRSRISSVTRVTEYHIVIDLIANDISLHPQLSLIPY